MAAEKRQAMAAADESVMPLVEFAIRWRYRSYAEALNALIRGDFPAHRVRGRWFVDRAEATRLLAARAGEAKE